MSSELSDLPPEIRSRLLSFLHEVDGHFEVQDKVGLINFIVDHSAQYPSLLSFVKLNEEFVVSRFKETGEVPPGVKLIKTSSAEGSNVTKLEIFHGSTTKQPEMP